MTILIRASSVPSMFDCALRWQTEHLEKRRTPKSLNAQLGTAVHKGTAIFDGVRGAGGPGNLPAAKDAAAEAMDKPEEEIALTAEDKPAQSKDIAVSLVDKYATEFAPTHDFIGVEIGVPALEIVDLDITLTGTADRVRMSDDGPGIADVKTGKTIVNTKNEVDVSGHASQIGVYELLAGAAVGQPMTAPAQVIGMQTNVTRDKQRIAIGTIVGARDVLIGDDQNRGLLPVMADIAHGRLTWGNPKSYMCHEKYCARFNSCFYRR